MPSHTEGIAMLSMYGDDEDDDMEDVDDQELPEAPAPSITTNDDSREVTQQQEERPATSVPTTPHESLFSPSQQQQQQQQQVARVDVNTVQIRKSRLTIVDYGHEEGALSPEAEEGEIIMATGRVMFGEQLHITDGELLEQKSPGLSRLPTPSTHLTPPLSWEPTDQPESDATNYGNELESVEAEDAVMVSDNEQKDVDPLDRFLPPPPKDKCSEELQEKIIKFLTLKKTAGRSFNAEVRNRKEYRNPDFLLHAVTYQNIDQIGSCFNKDVFDPHGYDKSDFYDEIEADMRREMERKEQERKKSQKIDFASGGLQPANIAPAPKLGLPTAGLSANAIGVPNVASSNSDVTARDGRQNKKSKWDKVDVDQRNSLVTGGQENLSAGAHAALMAAAKAGGGYSAFAHQRRKEAEEKRSSDKKYDKRS